MLSLILPARSVVQATPRTRILTLDLQGRPFAFDAGQAVSVGLAEGLVRRPYSIACSPHESRAGDMIELLVQIDDHAPPDPHLERASAGTLLGVEGPFGSFAPPSPLPEKHLLLVAGGTGIAPLRSIAREILESQPEVLVSLIYSARAPDEFAYRDELTALAERGRIDLHLTVTRDAHTAWAGSRGRIDASLIQSMIKTPETRVLACGPPDLVSATVALATAAGVQRDRVGWEEWGGLGN